MLFLLHQSLDLGRINVLRYSFSTDSLSCSAKCPRNSRCGWNDTQRITVRRRAGITASVNIKINGILDPGEGINFTRIAPKVGIVDQAITATAEGQIVSDIEAGESGE